MGKEIEGKFLVRTGSVPDLSGIEGKDIKQHYLSLSKEEEVRIRNKGNKFFITV